MDTLYILITTGFFAVSALFLMFSDTSFHRPPASRQRSTRMKSLAYQPEMKVKSNANIIASIL